MTGQSTATLRQLRMSPRKVRLFVDLIRGMSADEAIRQLEFSPKVAAQPLAKLVASAVANATNNHGLKPETLVIKEAYVDGGPMMYRWMPRAMGRATPVRKRTAHVTVVLTGEVIPGKEKKAAAAPVVSMKHDEAAGEHTDHAHETDKKKAGAPKKTMSKKKAVARKVTLQRRSGG